MDNRATKTQNGFTLVELLIAMAISLVIIGALAQAFISQRKGYDTQQEVLAMTQNARAAMDMISREVRMAGYNPTGSMQGKDPTAANFVGIPYNTAQLEIIADINGDGDASGSNEDIIYSYDATNLQIDRNTGGGNQPFAENIKAFSFQYLKNEDADADGNPDIATATEDIRMIKISIEAKTEKEDPDYTHPVNSDGHRTFQLESDITPPNLKYNQE